MQEKENTQRLLDAVWIVQARYWKERDALIGLEKDIGQFLNMYLSQVVPALTMGAAPLQDEPAMLRHAEPTAPRLKKRYAECMKLCHPDANQGVAVDPVLFTAMRDAYQKQDAPRLEALYLLACLSRLSSGKEKQSFLLRSYKEIRAGLDEVRREREALEASPEYQLWRRDMLARTQGVNLTHRVVSMLKLRQHAVVQPQRPLQKERMH